MNLAENTRNLQVMGDKIVLDVMAPSPAMHERKRMEKAIQSAIQEKFPDKDLQLNLMIPDNAQMTNNVIKGTPLEGVQNIIAIASGKGGVGKSTVTANLAVVLAQMGFKVGVLDADIYGPSQPTMFDVADEKPQAVNKNGKSLIAPVENYGVKLLSIGFFAGVNQAVVWRGPMATKALNQMIRDADWGALDFLLVDLPPGTGDIHLSLVQQLPITGAVIVSTPQAIALADVRKGVAMFQMDAIQVPVLGLVENMSYFTPAELPDNKYYIFGQDGVKHYAEDLALPFLGEIPLVQSIREAGDIGRPVGLQENGILKEVYEQIAQNMVESYPITPASDILHFMNQYRNQGVKILQAEDEIAAAGAALGASFGGALGVTASSGPGIALKAETINLAVMLEIPLVIANIQRGGPSTGLPTKTEQSDLLQVLYGRNGESPIPVIAAKKPTDAFWAAYTACKIAVEHMTPVMLLSDGYIANGAEPWKFPKADELPPIKIPVFEDDPDSFEPYTADKATDQSYKNNEYLKYKVKYNLLGADLIYAGDATLSVKEKNLNGKPHYYCVGQGSSQ
ncbi:unnamed protein product, partial [Cyprideis torosa]